MLEINDSIQGRKERLGQNLRKARIRAGLTAEELVDRLSWATERRRTYTTAAIYAWENGRNMVPERLLASLAQVLNCSSVDLGQNAQPVAYSQEVRICPTMDDVRERGHRAFNGSTISTFEMDEMLSRARDPNWPPE